MWQSYYFFSWVRKKEHCLFCFDYERYHQWWRLLRAINSVLFLSALLDLEEINEDAPSHGTSFQLRRGLAPRTLRVTTAKLFSEEKTGAVWPLRGQSTEPTASTSLPRRSAPGHFSVRDRVAARISIALLPWNSAFQTFPCFSSSHRPQCHWARPCRKSANPN